MTKHESLANVHAVSDWINNETEPTLTVISSDVSTLNPGRCHTRFKTQRKEQRRKRNKNISH